MKIPTQMRKIITVRSHAEFFFLSLLETACLFLETSERWNQNRVIWFIRFTDWRREARLSPTMLRWRNFNSKVGKVVAKESRTTEASALRMAAGE